MDNTFLDYLVELQVAYEQDAQRCRVIADDYHESAEHTGNEEDKELADLHGYYAASQHNKAYMLGQIQREYAKHENKRIHGISNK